MSSKSNLVVLEDSMVPDTIGVGVNMILNKYCKFHQFFTWKSPSRLGVSSKSNHGVLEDRIIPDTNEIGVNKLINVFWAYSENFIQFYARLYYTVKTYHI